MYENGVKLIEVEYIRDFPHIKSTNYLMSTMLAGKMKEKGAVDVLYHYQDQISEASRCNFFLVFDNEIKTSEAQILNGITRQRVLELPGLPLPINLTSPRMSELGKANEAFITSTTKGVLPVIQVGDQVIGDGKVGPVTKQLMEQINSF